MTPSETLVLVTGGSGFVGIHCIQQLLQQGYKVRTTVRSLSKKTAVLEMLRYGGIPSFKNLSFAEADLSKDNGWEEAVKGCKYVLHIASPIFLGLPKHEDDMIRPAVEGTLRVLKAARNAGVKRVVMTSNFGAVGYSHQLPGVLITEESWTDPAEKGLSAYNKSKIQAERAAWNFMAREGGELELSVINPMAIFGPSLGPELSSGFVLLKNMLDGSMKAIPNIVMGIVDVRDVADLHLRAMTSPAAKGQRFLALAGGTLSLPQIARLLKNNMPSVARRVSSTAAPDWAVRLAALFSKPAKAIVPLLGINRNASNQKAKSLLGWQPRSNEAAILAAVESMVKFGAI